MKQIYLDHVATTPIDPRVLRAMLPYLKKYWGNAQSLHSMGAPPAGAIENARHQLCALLNGYPCEIIFTSSGTEANNFAIKGVAWAQKNKGNHIIASKIEHHSILHPLKFLEKNGFRVTYLDVDRHGLINPDDVGEAITKDTILVSIHHANHEIGTIEPIEEISKICHEKDVLVHTDAVSSVGTIETDVKKLGVDLLSLSAHRFYGPKGAGALFVRKGVRLTPLIHGGVQESGKRAGTENVAGIVGLGKAAQIAMKEIPKRNKKILSLRRLLVGGLKKISDIMVNGHPTRVLPTHVNVSVGYVEGESLLALLDQEGIFAASGSACASHALKTSHVLNAVGVPIEFANGTLLFSIGVENTKSEINQVLKKMPTIVDRMRSISPLWRDHVTGVKTNYPDECEPHH